MQVTVIPFVSVSVSCLPSQVRALSPIHTRIDYLYLLMYVCFLAFWLLSSPFGLCSLLRDLLLLRLFCTPVAVACGTVNAVC